METLNCVIKFLVSNDMVGVNAATGDLVNLIMILIAVIALSVLVFTKLLNKNKHIYGKHISGGEVVSNTKIIQICSIVVLAVSLMAIAFTGVKAIANEIFSINDFEISADLQNNTVHYSQSNLTNNSGNDIKIKSIALSKEASVDDNDTVWTLKYGDKTLFSGQASGKDFPVEDIVIPAKETAPISLVAQDLSAQKVCDLAKSNSVISFSIKLDNAGVDYTVKHWKLDSDGKRSGRPTETESLKGSVGEMTNAKAKTYDGYTAKDFDQQIIKEDGTTEVDIEYLPHKTNISLDTNGGTPGSITSVTATYGSDMPAITGSGALPTRTGYTFIGYFDGKDDTATKYYNGDGTSAKAWDKDVEKETLYAHWTALYTVDAEVDAPGHGSIDGGPFYNIPDGTPYTVDNTNKKITIGSGTDEKVIQYSDDVGWTLDKWMIGKEEEAKSGTITSNITFTAKTTSVVYRIDYNRKEYIGEQEVTLRYYPVFSSVPEDVHFYGDDKTEYTSMNEKITYALAPKGTAIKAVRSINSSYNSVYGSGGDIKPKEAQESWKIANLAKETDESVEKLSIQTEPSGEPTINTIGLITIWKTCNPNKSRSGFGGYLGQFWSCVAKSPNYAWNWYCNEGGSWKSNGRNVSSNMYVCVSRTLS